MSPAPTLYRISPAGRDEVDVAPVWSQPEAGAGPLAAGLHHLVPLPDGHHLLAIGGDAKGSVFRVTAEEPWVEAADATVDLGGAWDIVRPFVIGDRPHLLAYTAAEPGHFAFFPLTPGFEAEPPYLFSRVREPGPTGGYDMIEPIVVDGMVHYMCYDADTGKVVIYALQVTATGTDGQPPLLSRAVWVHQWAAKWTRFAYFRLGAGTYFLKTNVGRLNVNIDHVLDDPSQGAVEVGSHLDLPNALDLTLVAPLVSPQGDPGFITYMPDGVTTVNRIHGDCQAWSTQATLATLPAATHLIVQIPNPRRARSGMKVPWASYTVWPSTRHAAVDVLRSSVISQARSRVKSSSKSS